MSEEINKEEEKKQPEISLREQTEQFIQQYQTSDNPVLFLNSFEIAEDYKVFFADLKTYIQIMTPKELNDDDLKQILFANPRFLYDYFDSKKMYVNIMGAENKWYYSIEKVKHSAEDFKNRIICEYKAMMDVIGIINKI